MDTYFKVGQMVRSVSNAQGLVPGWLYEVVEVRERATAFGNFVVYDVREAGNRVLSITNAHLLLEACVEDAPPVAVDVPAPKAPRVARIDYTTEHPRRGATRRTREVRASEEKLPAAVERALKKISDFGGYNAVVRYEVAS